jgi:hypothetical protein
MKLIHPPILSIIFRHGIRACSLKVYIYTFQKKIAQIIPDKKLGYMLLIIVTPVWFGQIVILGMCQVVRSGRYITAWFIYYYSARHNRSSVRGIAAAIKVRADRA